MSILKMEHILIRAVSINVIHILRYVFYLQLKNVKYEEGY